LDIEVWISKDSTISNASILALEELLRPNLKKIFLIYAPMAWNQSTQYWAGMELGLMDIYNFPGFICTMDGLKDVTRH